MKALSPSQKPQIILVGVVILALGSFSTTTGVLQAQQTRSTVLDSLANGTHLYGEAPQPGQIGKGYVTFSYRDGRVVGAFYYPRSEFDCFVGFFKDNTLDVKSVGTDPPEVVALKVNLSDLHAIPTLSNSDQQMISICQRETAGRLI